jgi:hypothetical protein
MPTLNGISYDLKEGYPKEYISNTGITIEHKYQCAWGDRLELMKNLLGWWTGSSFNWPHKYEPEAAGGLLRDVYATKCNIEPLGPVTDDSYYYKKAILNVTYERLDYYNGSFTSPGGTVSNRQVLFTERLEPAAEFLTLNRSNLYWGTGNDKYRLKDEDIETPTMVIKMLDWVLEFSHVQYLNTNHLDAIGKVNLTEVTPRTLGVSFPAETLLCGNVSASREFTRSFNNPAYSTWAMTYRFTYRNNGTYASPMGWNHYPRTDNASSSGLSWERITQGTDNIPIYKTMEFNTVFGL